ncbi:DNA-binding protein [Streptomyces sp. 891-h]|nr:DNA-binding protein [Streptomyces sp. 891-h]
MGIAVPELKRRLQQLASGECSAEEVSTWALEIMESDSPELDDEAVWTALDQLSGADLLMSPDTPLHGKKQFEEWLEEFVRKSSPS